MRPSLQVPGWRPLQGSGLRFKVQFGMIIYSSGSCRRSLGLHLRWVLLGLAVLMLLPTAPLGSAASPAYLTNGVSQSGMKLVTIDSHQGVLANYTSTYSGSFDGFVYLALTNTAGQTAYWNVASCSFNGNQTVQCFVTISPTVPSGTYTAWVFVTTAAKVPVSLESSLNVTL